MFVFLEHGAAGLLAVVFSIIFAVLLNPAISECGYWKSRSLAVTVYDISKLIRDFAVFKIAAVRHLDFQKFSTSYFTRSRGDAFEVRWDILLLLH